MTGEAGPTRMLRTRRLLLRPFRDSDLPALARIHADPDVRRFLPGTLDRAAGDALVERIRLHHARHGFGLLALEVPGVARFAGFVGLARVEFDAPFSPAVEVGWRLARDLWGRGYATEGARACLAHGFHQLGLDEIVSFTAEGNLRSRRVMERLGMRRNPAEDFDHPHLPPGHRLRRHVLYRLARQDFDRLLGDPRAAGAEAITRPAASGPAPRGIPRAAGAPRRRR